MPGTNWYATNLRIALFTQQAAPLTDVYTPFVGVSPDSQEDRPKEGVRHQVGKIENAELRTTITPLMVDFTFATLPITAETVMGDLSLWSVGELKTELAKLERRALAWLPKWEVPTIRMSLLVQARAPAASAEGAYEILKDNLRSVEVRPGEMRDMRYRINWRAKTNTIEEGYYNRLTTWSAVNIKATAKGGVGRPELTIQDKHFAQVEMDINTPGERAEPLPQDKMNIICSELFQLAVKIAETGEI